jgi:glycosyltransferase involved in cell wall biosynthesis
MRVLRNGIVLDDFCFLESIRENKRDELGLNQSDKVLLHVGRFDKAKNQRFAIDVFKEVSEKDGDYRFIFAGAGEMFDTVKEYANTSDVHDKIKFLGLRSDISDLMMAADALLFPSLYEGLSVVLIEAQTSGLPCVITDTLAEESTIREELVTRLPLGDAGVWAETTRAIVDRRDRSHRTSSIAPEYNIKNIAVELEHFYLQRASEEDFPAGIV